MVSEETGEASQKQKTRESETRKKFCHKKYSLVKKGKEKKPDITKSDERPREQPHTVVDELIDEGMTLVQKEKDVNVPPVEAVEDAEAKLQRLKGKDRGNFGKDRRATE